MRTTFLIQIFGCIPLITHEYEPLIWPYVALGVVGGYGFLVWMYQLLTGPPGPTA
jgi:hypothetical protein